MLSVNFRGSTGFGKKFTNAGDKEWARKMHDDLIDGVKWAVDRKIADPAKVAIEGGSYGATPPWSGSPSRRTRSPAGSTSWGRPAW